MANLTLNLNNFSGYANVSAGSHNLTLVAKAQGYLDSPVSAATSINVTANTFDTMTWDQVIEACRTHTLNQIRGAVVGATKSITIDGISYPFVILGFEHDTLTTPDSYGTTAHCTFQMRDCYKTSQKMNSSDTNTGGWGSSALRTWCNGTFKNLLPSNIKGALKTIHKPYLKTYNSQTISYVDDAIYIPSEFEVFGVGRTGSSATYTSGNMFAIQIEGTQYPYYKQSIIPSGFTQIGNTGSFTGTGGSYTSRLGTTITTTNGRVYNYNAVRGLQTASETMPASSTSWWESSPDYYNSSYFCLVYRNGIANDNSASNAYGAAPAFSL